MHRLCKQRREFSRELPSSASVFPLSLNLKHSLVLRRECENGLWGLVFDSI